MFFYRVFTKQKSHGKRPCYGSRRHGWRPTYCSATMYLLPALVTHVPLLAMTLAVMLRGWGKPPWNQDPVQDWGRTHDFVRSGTSWLSRPPAAASLPWHAKWTKVKKRPDNTLVCHIFSPPPTPNARLTLDKNKTQVWSFMGYHVFCLLFPY